MGFEQTVMESWRTCACFLPPCILFRPDVFLVHRLSRPSTFVYSFTARVRGQGQDGLEPAENREKHHDVNWVATAGPVDIAEEWMADGSIKALVFDVFGTVVDWRTSVAREVEAVAREKGWTVDATAFAVNWRARYQPSMDPVRRGEKPYARLDDLHRDSLKAVLAEAGLDGSLDGDELEHLNRAWHRLTPWPDSVPGLTRLKTRFVLATMSNGNTALMVNMAKNAGLPWDTILGSEPAQNYKPVPSVYLTGADWLGLRPDEVLMTAAHNTDLAAARALGFKTAFVLRPNEHGPEQTTDLAAAEDWTYVADSMEDLAGQLGC